MTFRQNLFHSSKIQKILKIITKAFSGKSEENGCQAIYILYVSQLVWSFLAAEMLTCCCRDDARDPCRLQILNGYELACFSKSHRF